jgi:helicase
MGLLELPLNRRLLADLSARIDGRLLPLQRHAVEQTALLAGESLLVSAPTASGKTLLAELAAIRALEASRTVLYLVPTRALAAEKARELSRWLAPHGIRVAQSTRDHREEDASIVAGRVGVAVAVYEKTASLLARDPGMMARTGLIVCDEVQLLGEPRRGGVIDLLLAQWKLSPAAHRPQLLALSAVLARPEALAAWLGVRLLRWDSRPFPLREGTLDIATGFFRWRDAATAEEGEEALIEQATPSEGLADVVARLAETCAPVLVFCATRREANALAREAAGRMQRTGPGRAGMLEALPPSQIRSMLEELFPAGVGLHTADLTEEQRLVVEQAFAHGDLPVLIATPTLEQGVNLRAATVVHSPRMIGEDPVTGAAIALPLARIRYRNQAGRAGRTSGTIGRSILVVDGAFEADQARRSLLAAGLEEVQSHLSPGEWLGAAAVSLAHARSRTVNDIETLFAATLALHHAAPGTARTRADEAVALGARAGYWTIESDDRIRLLPAGEAAAATGLAPDTMSEWSRWFAEVESPPEPLALLFFIMLAEEAGQELPPVDRAAWRRNQWVLALAEALSGRTPLARRLRGELTERGGAPQRWHGAARAALILADWIGGHPLVDMEETHNLPGGRIERLARTAAWLASGAATLCGCLGRPAQVIDAMEELASTLSQSPAACGPTAPTRKCEPPDSAQSPLVFPESDVGHVLFNGRKVRLQPLQYRLLQLLASRPGCAVSYAEIHEKVWQNVSVEQRQVCHHRVQIEKRLGVPPHSLIETHPGWGLALKIPATS